MRASSLVCVAAALRPHHMGDTTAPVALVQAFLNQQNGEEAATHLALISLGIAVAAVIISELGRHRWRRRWHGRPRMVKLPG